MEEAAVLGNRIGIMAEGVLKCIGTPLFLINRYGKYMSITVNLEHDADNEEIVQWFKQRASGVEFEVLSQEILIRIPKYKPDSTTKENNIEINSFFKDLDASIKDLSIKDYSASMPTLEDVFLNVGSVRMEEEEMLQEGKVNEEENERIMFKEKYIKDYTRCGKLWSETRILYKKRFLQVIRDPRTFVLEIICPILLTLVGCIVVQVEIYHDTDPIYVNDKFLSEFGDQVIYYGNPSNMEPLLQNYEIEQHNVTSEFIPGNRSYMNLTDPSDRLNGLKEFIENIYDRQKNSEKISYGSLYLAYNNFVAFPRSK